MLDVTSEPRRRHARAQTSKEEEDEEEDLFVFNDTQKTRATSSRSVSNRMFSVYLIQKHDGPTREHSPAQLQAANARHWATCVCVCVCVCVYTEARRPYARA